MRTKQVFSAYRHEDAAKESPYRYCPVCATHLRAPDDTALLHACPRCDWIHYHNPAPGVVALIANGDRVLLGRRAKSSYGPGSWCLPGGFIEYHEDFLSAARREVLEETGLIVEITSILSVMSNFLNPRHHTLVIVLEARIIAGEPLPGDDLVALDWFPVTGPFPEMAFEADLNIIERYFHTNLKGIPVDSCYARPGATDSESPPLISRCRRF